MFFFQVNFVSKLTRLGPLGQNKKLHFEIRHEWEVSKTSDNRFRFSRSEKKVKSCYKEKIWISWISPKGIGNLLTEKIWLINHGFWVRPRLQGRKCHTSLPSLDVGKSLPLQLTVINWIKYWREGSKWKVHFIYTRYFPNKESFEYIHWSLSLRISGVLFLSSEPITYESYLMTHKL